MSSKLLAFHLDPKDGTPVAALEDGRVFYLNRVGVWVSYKPVPGTPAAQDED